MLLKVNDIDVINYKEINYKYNKQTYYTFEYNKEYKLKTNDIISFKCNCGRVITKNFYPNKNSQYFLCSSCKTKKTLQEKYGVDNISQIESVKEKKKKTLQEKYGVDNISQIESVKEKKKKTMIKNHGTNNPFSLDKTKKTIFEKYGYNNVNKSKEIRDKIKQTNIKKYGYSSILANKTIMKKAIKNKYNNENFNNRKKAFNTNLKKYGEQQPWKFGSKKQIYLTLTKSYNNFIKSENIKPTFSLEDYLTKENKYDTFQWKCITCNTEFQAYYANGIEPRCPTCYPKINGYSLREKEIVEWCKSLGLDVIENDRELISPYEVDIYIPGKKLAIEYNGLYYHSIKFKLDRWYHQKKVELAYRKGVRLLHVWEHEDIDEIKQNIEYYLENDDFIEVEKPKLYNIHDNLIWI